MSTDSVQQRQTPTPLAAHLSAPPAPVPSPPVSTLIRFGVYGLLLAVGMFGACDPDSECKGDVDVQCTEDGCICQSGDAQGESCVEDPDDPDWCEVKCCDPGLF